MKAGELVNNCYIIRSSLGQDSFCELWRASAIFSASDFLLRILKNEYSGDKGGSEAFEESAWRSYEVAAPSVAPLIEIDRASGRVFLVSEYGACEELEEKLRKGFTVGVEQACRLILELAEGLDAFHRKGLIYGTLTPESVLLRDIGGRIEELKLQKPSYADLFSSVPDEDVQTLRRTWAYASPEFKRGDPVDARSDLYSLGVLLYRLLAGKLPYGSRTGVRIKERTAVLSHVTASLARRGIPRDVTSIVVRSLRKNPALRYDDTIKLVADLRRFLDFRREAAIRSGGVDPMADLATLNLQNAKAEAHEIVRSLDTMDYFRFLSESAVSQSDQRSIKEIIKIFRVTPGVEEIEELESEADDDDEGRDVESYIAEGYGKVGRETPISPEKDLSIHDERPVPKRTSLVSPQGLSTEKPPTPNEVESKFEGEQALSPPRNGEGTNPLVSWRRESGSVDRVAELIFEAVEKARTGKGAFRFIQELPQESPFNFVEMVDREFGKSVLIFDIGLVSNMTGLNEVGSFMSQAGKTAGLGEPIGVPKGSKGMIRYLVSLARPERPLILIGHGAERVGKRFYHSLMRLAAASMEASLCVFLFYGTSIPEKWHILASLRDKKGNHR